MCLYGYNGATLAGNAKVKSLVKGQHIQESALVGRGSAPRARQSGGVRLAALSLRGDMMVGGRASVGCRHC